MNLSWVNWTCFLPFMMQAIGNVVFILVSKYWDIDDTNSKTLNETGPKIHYHNFTFEIGMILSIFATIWAMITLVFWFFRARHAFKEIY